MSSRKGGKTKGPPKHQNSVAWVPDRGVKKKESEPGSKRKPLGQIACVCSRCHDQIAWRRKYGKYKMLTEPAKCASCSRRTVKDAYHAICRECSSQQKVCAKCRRPSESIIPDLQTEEQQERAALEEALSTMRERERRTLLREMAKPNSNPETLLARSRERRGSDDESGEWGDSESDEDDDDEEEKDEDGDASGSRTGKTADGQIPRKDVQAMNEIKIEERERSGGCSDEEIDGDDEHESGRSDDDDL